MMKVSDFKCFISELVSHSAAERAARQNQWKECKDAADWKKPPKRITKWELFFFFFFFKDLQDSCRTAESSSEVLRIYFEDADPFGFVQIVYTQQ